MLSENLSKAFSSFKLQVIMFW